MWLPMTLCIKCDCPCLSLYILIVTRRSLSVSNVTPGVSLHPKWLIDLSVSKVTHRSLSVSLGRRAPTWWLRSWRWRDKPQHTRPACRPTVRAMQPPLVRSIAQRECRLASPLPVARVGSPGLWNISILLLVSCVPVWQLEQASRCARLWVPSPETKTGQVCVGPRMVFQRLAVAYISLTIGFIKIYVGKHCLIEQDLFNNKSQARYTWNIVKF